MFRERGVAFVADQEITFFLNVEKRAQGPRKIGSNLSFTGITGTTVIRIYIKMKKVKMAMKLQLILGQANDPSGEQIYSRI